MLGRRSKGATLTGASAFDCESRIESGFPLGRRCEGPRIWGASGVLALVEDFQPRARQLTPSAELEESWRPPAPANASFFASDHSGAPIGRWHHQVEKEPQESGMDWTILRSHDFMQNLLAQAEYIIKEGAVYSASGDGKIPYTGSEAMSYRQAAEIIAAAIGRPLRVVDESPEEARARRVREGLPPAVIERALAIAAYQRAGGKTVTITSTVADLTGRPPRTVAEFAREHAAVFRGEK
jgi:uncharacterized protein YbjT (DUF2867 family)